MNSILKKSFSGVCLFLTCSISNSATNVATQTIQVGAPTTERLPPLTVLKMSDAELLDKGCVPSVMDTLNNDYLFNRGRERELELQTLVKQQVDWAPPAEGTNVPSAPGSNVSAGSCFQQAANNINNAVNAANTVLGILSGGGLSAESVVNAAVGVAKNIACQQVNNYTGTLTSTASQPIVYTMSDINRVTYNTGVNTKYGSVSTGQVLTNGGFNPYGNETIPKVDNNIISSCDSLSSCNPFK